MPDCLAIWIHQMADPSTETCSFTFAASETIQVKMDRMLSASLLTPNLVVMESKL